MYRLPPGWLSCGSPHPQIAAGGVDAASRAGLETGATPIADLWNLAETIALAIAGALGLGYLHASM
jgi:hypothetical protein